MPLPEDWSAEVAPDLSLRAGPKGRTVLRIDVRSGSRLPTPAELRSTVSKEDKDVRVSTKSEISTEEVSLVTLELTRGSLHTLALLGAHRVGQDLFLCATAPGITEEELSRAVRACEGLGPKEGP